MADAERTFSPETAARRQRKVERDKRMLGACRDALSGDGVDTTTVVRDRTFDGATDLAIARATAANEAGRPLRWQEKRAVSRDVLARQAGAQPAGQPEAKRPSLRERLEALSEKERIDAIASVTPGTRERAYIEHLVASITEVEEEADYLAARQNEEAELALGDDEPFDWGDEEGPEQPDFYSAGLAAHSRAVNAEWYSDDTAEGWELEEEGE